MASRESDNETTSLSNDQKMVSPCEREQVSDNKLAQNQDWEMVFPISDWEMVFLISDWEIVSFISKRKTASAEFEREIMSPSSFVKAGNDIDSGTELNYVTTERGKKRRFRLGMNTELPSQRAQGPDKSPRHTGTLSLQATPSQLLLQSTEDHQVSRYYLSLRPFN